MSHAAGHFFIFFTYFPTYIYGEEQHFATLSANSTYAAGPIIQPPNLGSTDRMTRAGFEPTTS